LKNIIFFQLFEWYSWEFTSVKNQLIEYCDCTCMLMACRWLRRLLISYSGCIILLHLWIVFVVIPYCGAVLCYSSSITITIVGIINVWKQKMDTGWSPF